MTKTEFINKIAKIQQTLKAPKNQYNKFGGYYYRNCEDILESVKPLLGDLILTINDEIVQIGNRYYVRATATITDGEHEQSATAYAREEESKKGLDSSQVTGSTSSYARKYACNALFCIDDTKDADSDEQPKPAQPKLPYPPKSVINEIDACKNIPEIAVVLRKYQQTYDNEQLSKVASERKKQILAIQAIPDTLDSLPDFLN